MTLRESDGAANVAHANVAMTTHDIQCTTYTLLLLPPSRGIPGTRRSYKAPLPGTVGRAHHVHQ